VNERIKKWHTPKHIGSLKLPAFTTLRQTSLNSKEIRTGSGTLGAGVEEKSSIILIFPFYPQKTQMAYEQA
jgi:hypothetical protein